MIESRRDFRTVHPVGLLALLVFLAGALPAAEPAPRLILRGGTLVDGTGAPPRGPVDVVLEGDRIVEVVSAGAPGAPRDLEDRPAAGPGGRELDVSGMYVLPGFVDLFAHAGRLPPEYLGKLWTAHGVTTIRDVACRFGPEDCREIAARAEGGELVYPRVVPFHTFVPRLDAPEGRSEEARAWVAQAEREGAVGLRIRGGPLELQRAAAEAGRKRGLPVSLHHVAEEVARADVLDTTAWGVSMVEHAYGVPEALLPAGAVQELPPGYNHSDEGQRFAQVARIWDQTAAPGSERWDRVVELLVERDVTLVPTLALYEANRNLMAARTAEWHRRYTLPELWRSFAPSRRRHAAHWFYWTTADEVAWRRAYRAWMGFLHDFQSKGGRVAVGSDAGFMYALHGFATVRELELLQEAGFHPLEVIRAATLSGAEALGMAGEIGSVEPGKRADLVVVPENPLENLKVLYGTGALKLDEEDRPIRVGGVRYTIRSGVVHDAPALLEEVRERVGAARAEEGVEAEEWER